MFKYMGIKITKNAFGSLDFNAWGHRENVTSLAMAIYVIDLYKAGILPIGGV